MCIRDSAGAGYLGVLANAGLAMDLSDYREQYKWDDRFHDWALEKTVYDGKLYGVACLLYTSVPGICTDAVFL